MYKIQKCYSLLAELDILFHTTSTNRIFRQISPGEVDSVGSEDWNYGYVLGSTFTIFSTDNLVLKQNDQVVTLIESLQIPY
jgi:molybdopterin-binding protein